MKFFPGKKGGIILMIVGVIIVTLIIFMANSKAKSYAKSDPILKEYIANDLALMINTLMVPGDVIVEYPQNVSEYIFLLSSKEVSVYRKDTETSFLYTETSFELSVYRKDEVIINRVQKNIVLPKGYHAVGDVEGKDRICIKKSNKNIFLEECDE